MPVEAPVTTTAWTWTIRKTLWACENFDGPHMGHNRRTFPQDAQKPSSEAAASEEARRTLRYVEPLSEARTKLADIFSIRRDTTTARESSLLDVIKN